MEVGGSSIWHQTNWCKWVYKNKYKSDGPLDKHKLNLVVVKGYIQKEGIDYEETFSPTKKWASINVLLDLEAHNRWNIHHMDVNTYFLNGIRKTISTYLNHKCLL
jgi:hypothetical protein